MENQISISLDLSEIRAILDNLGILEMELRKLNSPKWCNIRAIEDYFKFTEEEWDFILERDKLRGIARK